MEDIYRNLSTLDYWGPGYGTDTSFQVTELWQNDKSAQVSVLHKKIDPINRDGWVSEEMSGTEDAAQTLIARMAWIDVSLTDKGIKQSEQTVSFLVSAFGLKLAYAYGRSCASGTTALPVQAHGENEQVQPFCFCYPPKVAAVWAQRNPKSGNQGRPLTQAVFFVQEEEKKALKRAVQGQWSPPIYANHMFPSLLLALVIGVQIDATTSAIKSDIRGVERRTGYHNFASRDGEKRSEGELDSLLAKTSGSASKLASTSRKSKVLESLLKFTQRILDESIARHQELVGDASSMEPARENTAQNLAGYSVLKSHISVLQNRQEMQVTDIEYTLKRVQVQSDALFNIIQQIHATNNLMLSQSTEQIAFFSYRDAASMKTLAVVTMFFLPGSFISALFSTNCFEWASVDLTSSSIGVKSTPQMSLYWAITIPLTVLTFCLYFLWLAFQKHERDRMVKDQEKERALIDDQLERSLTPKSLEEAEDRKLARRRMTMMEKRASTFGRQSW